MSPWTRWRDRRKIRRVLRLIDHYGLPRVDESSSVGLGSPLLDAPSARSHSRRASALPRVDAPNRDAA